MSVPDNSLTKPGLLPESAESTLAGGGEMGALMRAFNWDETVIGPVANWPQSLKTAVRIILTSRYAMFVWWGRELINLYNDPYRVFLGIKHPEALGRSARDVWAEIWDQIGPRADAVLFHGESTFDEALLLLMERHGYLEETYFTFSYSPLPDDQGSVGGLFCAVTEETERVIGERRLTLLREMAGEMAGSLTPDQVCHAAARCLSQAQRDLPFSLIYLLDSTGTTLKKVSCAGIDPHHSAAQDYVSLDVAENSIWQFRKAMESGKPELIENVDERIADLPTAAWSRPPRHAVVAPIAQQGQTRPAGVLVAGLNPHRKFDHEFKGFVSLLANQIAASIANAVAYETERSRAEALAELDRSKTLFFSNVSHEFRTPLTLMLGPIEDLLRNERLPAEDQEQLAVAHRNALRLLKLVNTLLDFSRIEAGRMQAIYEPTNLCSLTLEIASVFRSAMEKAGLRYSVDCQPLAEPVYVDREMWEKVVLNLLSNAFKFTFTGEVAVSLKDGDQFVELSVRDTGVGIPAEELPRIFERFHRIENTRARTYEGTGIGLAFVQELVKLHHGTVQAKSTPDQGSTFIISIPKGTSHLAPDRIQAKSIAASTASPRDSYIEEAQRWLPQASTVKSETTPPVSGIESDVPATKRELIVLADDNADMREYVARLLGAQYRVHAVSDGAQALDAVRHLHPSVVVADIMMPHLDGFGLLRAIRNDPEVNTIPVILLSARAGEESRVEGFQAGADDYLFKPFTARELLARVETHVRMARIRRQAAEREAVLRAETAQARERLAAIVESSDDAIVAKDLRGIVTSWNAAAERIFGYRAEEIIGRSITTIIPPELHDDERRILETIARGESIDHFETVRVRKNGERLNVSVTVSPVRDEKGRVIGAAKIARDITEQRKAEQALHISERLASVGRLAATMAHEINNPLEAVFNFIYLARNSAVRDDVRAYLKGAEEELERVSYMTRQTLGFYRETRGAAAVQLGPIVDSLIAVFSSRLRNKQIQIRSEIAEEDGKIIAVPDEIRQLLANLLGNSIDAVPNGGQIRVRVAVAPGSAGSGHRSIRLTVADSGCGIPLEIRSKLFEPFLTTKKDVGTGLGLWVCKSIVEKYGGVIRIRTSAIPGKSWTVFSVFFPLSEKQPAPAQEMKLAV